MDCIFCKIVKGEIQSAKVYEDCDFLAFLDINPVNKGHTLLIPKKHCENLMDLPKDIETDFLEIAKKIADAVLKATGAGGFNIGMNNGEAAGQVVPHAHFHIIPRFKGDGHMHWEQGSYAKEEIDAYKEKIDKHL